jgi:hypothetical protein
MKHVIDFARHKNKLRYVVPDEAKIGITGQMRHIIWRSRDKVVDCDHTEPFPYQAIAQM